MPRTQKLEGRANTEKPEDHAKTKYKMLKARLGLGHPRVRLGQGRSG